MKKTLKLLMLLSGIRKYDVVEIAERFEITERTVYRYLNEIENSGFIIERDAGCYSLLQSDCRTKSLKKLLHFSEEEAYILYRALLELGEYRRHAKNIINKLHTLYDFRALQKMKESDELSKIKSLSNAIEANNQVMLLQYHSSNSHKIEDRHVEPFEIMSDYEGVWCFDMRDGKVKQFKISRMMEVKALPHKWQHANNHKTPFADAFRMSAPEPIAHVEAALSMRAYNLLKEEHPAALCYIKKVKQNYYLNIPIADFHGIGRFVLGLSDEIKVYAPIEFINFLNRKQKIKF